MTKYTIFEVNDHLVYQDPNGVYWISKYTLLEAEAEEIADSIRQLLRGHHPGNIFDRLDTSPTVTYPTTNGVTLRDIEPKV